MKKPKIKTLASSVLSILPFLLSTSPVQAEVIYRYVDQAILVDSLLERIDPKAVIISPANYNKIKGGKFAVTLDQEGKAPEVVYLKTTLNWLKNDPPLKTEFLSTEVGQINVRSVQGTVEAKVPDSGAWVVALPGMALPIGSIIRTGEDSKASVQLPGLQSVIAGQDATFALEQTATENKVKTQLKVDQGTLFIKSAKFKGIPHDFSIRTPLGIAAARGTEYLTSHEDRTSVICVVEGEVKVLKDNQEQVANLNVKSEGELLFQAIPELSGRQYAEWLYQKAQEIAALNPDSTGTREFTAYLPVLRTDSQKDSIWEATSSNRIKW